MRLPSWALRALPGFFRAGVALLLAAPAAGATFGAVIPMPGHVSELALDEPRSALYAANFTARQVHVISTITNQLISSIPVGGQASGLALSPDGRYLVVTNYNNFGGPALSSITVVNLVDQSRQNYAISSPPLAVAFGADGDAVILTTVDFQLFRPSTGAFQQLYPIDSLAKGLPVPSPAFPREIIRASMTASGDGNFIFGMTDSFVFSYQVPSTFGILNVRLLGSFIRPPAPPLATAAFDGSSFLAGQYLLDRRLRVLAEQTDTDLTRINVGGHLVDSSVQTIYASFPELPVAGLSGPAVAAGPQLRLLDADNFTLRERWKLTEPITGRMVLAGGGRALYAVSDSGILHLPLAEMATTARLRPSVEQIFFQFDFCQRASRQQQFRIENPGGGSADFAISSTLPGVSFNPSRGTAPATIEVIADFGEFSRTQGTSSGQILITSQNAINLVEPIAISVNVKDADQNGRVVPLPGRFVDVLADPRRDQFYALEQTKNTVHVFQNSDLRLLTSFRTGNRPNWMTLTGDRRYLLVANSAGENLTVINLDTMQNEGHLFTPPGHHPVSVAADSATVLVASRVPGGGAKIDRALLDLRAIFPLGRLGIYENAVHADTSMTPLTNLSGILIAEANGHLKLWDAASQEVIVARRDFTALRGSLAAGPSAVVVDNYLLNTSLVPQARFADGPNQAAGFTFLSETGVRTSMPSGKNVDPGAVQRFDARAPALNFSPVRMAEQPAAPSAFPFNRSLAALRNGAIISLTASGLVELAANFDAGIAIPQVEAITSAADFSGSLASGGLISIFGKSLARETAAASTLPLSTNLGGVCVTANGFRLPLLSVSPGQINAQLPFELVGRMATVLHTPGGLSGAYFADVRPAAPAVFQISAGDPSTSIPAVVRTKNNQLATLSNPVRPNETILVFATGLGDVGPAVEAGMPGPSSPLAATRTIPQVTLGGMPAPLYFAGLAPGLVGVYQLNVKVPGDAPLGLQVPLRLAVGAASTTVNLRVVD